MRQEGCGAHRQAVLVQVLDGPLQAFAVGAADLDDLRGQG